MADPDVAAEQVEQEQDREAPKELRALIPGAEVLFRFPTCDPLHEPVRRARLQPALRLLRDVGMHRRRARHEGDKDFTLRKGNREAIAGSVAMALAFTGVLYVVTDLVFGTVWAIVAAAGLFGLTGWRWWALALFRAAAERRQAR